MAIIVCTVYLAINHALSFDITSLCLNAIYIFLWRLCLRTRQKSGWQWDNQKEKEEGVQAQGGKQENVHDSQRTCLWENRVKAGLMLHFKIKEEARKEEENSHSIGKIYYGEGRH